MRFIKIIIPLLLLFLTVSCNSQTNKYPLKTDERKIVNYCNDILVIDSLIDLAGGSIELPACYKLVFDGGGAIRNGIVYLDLNTYFIEGGVGVFDNVDLLPKGGVSNVKKSPIREINALWFGVTSNETNDNTLQLQKAIDAGHAFAIPVFLPRGYYCINNTLKLYEGDFLKGESIGRLTSENQKGASFIRYCGQGKEIISVLGPHVTIENLLIAGKTPYQVDGLSLKKNAGLYLCMNNVLLVNTRNGISCLLDKDEGFSGCILDKVSIWKCVRGISVDISHISGQYITYNNFYNMIISAALEKGVYLHCRALNSSVFRDCIIERVGYGPGYNENYKNTEIAAIYAQNEATQGSLIVDGGYFEDIYFSKESEPDITYNDELSSVFNIKNISLSINNVRFANTRIIAQSKGIDNVVISNCIDNGYYRKNKRADIPICLSNVNTALDINHYVLAENNKILYTSTGGEGKIKSCDVKNVRNKKDKSL